MSLPLKLLDAIDCCRLIWNDPYLVYRFRRLRRFNTPAQQRRRFRPTQAEAREIVARSHEYYVPKIVCTCPQSLEAVRRYGQNLFLGYDDGPMHLFVCPDAWKWLNYEFTAHSRYISMPAHNTLMFETAAGTISIKEGEPHESPK